MDHSAPLPRDSAMRTANHAEGEWLRKAKEDKNRKKQRKLQAWEQGEDTDDDDDDDDGEVMDGAVRIVERRVVIVSGSDRGDCEGFLTFPRLEPKGTLVNCSWLV